MKLVVTIPAQNEEQTIAQVVGGVPRDLPGIDDIEIMVLDDESTDRTAEVARRAGAMVLPVHGRPGLGKVFQSGIDAAMRRGADYVVNIDGDGQFDPADIAQLVQPLVEDEADFVTCSRFKNHEYRPQMPLVKYFGNWAVVKIVNSVCGGGSRFTDVSCGFRAFNREALYRLTLFGRYTYTQECFIDLFAKGLRIVEVPLRVRGVREYGESRVAGSIWKYGANTGPIILRAMRDIRPLKFFGIIGLLIAIPAVAMLGIVTVNYILTQNTYPFTSLITLGAGLMTVAFVMGVLALLADMMARHRRITEELLYLARRRIYGAMPRASELRVEEPLGGVAARAGAVPAGNGRSLSRVRAGKLVPLSPIQRSVPDEHEALQEPAEVLTHLRKPAKSGPRPGQRPATARVD